MGTNYYVRYNLCDCCKRYDELHMCKSFRMFRAYPYGPHLWGDIRPTPWGEVQSVDDWFRVLESNEVEVWDEYGTPHDVRDVVATIKDHLESSMRSYEQALDAERSSPWLDAKVYQDGQGYAMAPYEFS